MRKQELLTRVSDWRDDWPEPREQDCRGCGEPTTATCEAIIGGTVRVQVPICFGCWQSIPAAPPSASDGGECAHCPDGHRQPGSKPMAVEIGPVRDADGQPVELTVRYCNGHHVSEREARWLRGLIAAASDGEGLRELWLTKTTFVRGGEGLWHETDDPDHARRAGKPVIRVRDLPAGETGREQQLVEFDAWLSMRGEFREVLTAFRRAFGTDTSAAAGEPAEPGEERP